MRRKQILKRSKALAHRINKTHPKIIDALIGLGFTVIILAIIEWGLFYPLNYWEQKEIEIIWSGKLDQADELLGYNGKSNVQISQLYRYHGQEVFNVTYSTDRFHRRITPLPDPASRPHLILFFGGSFTFGEGVNDDETLPCYVAQLAPRYRVLNYGYRGYGPHQMLAKLQSNGITREVAHRDGHRLLIYTFIDGHVGRVIGSMFNMNWAYRTPYYRLAEQDQLIKVGDFSSNRPVTTFLYRVISHSELVTYFDLDYPRLNEDHFRLTARIIEEARDVFQRKFNSDDFYVLIYPGSRYGPRLIPYLKAAGVNYLDYSSLLDPTEPQFHLAGDLHPTAAAYKIIATRVVKDINLAGKTGAEELGPNYSTSILPNR